MKKWSSDILKLLYDAHSRHGRDDEDEGFVHPGKLVESSARPDALSDIYYILDAIKTPRKTKRRILNSSPGDGTHMGLSSEDSLIDRPDEGMQGMYDGDGIGYEGNPMQCKSSITKLRILPHIYSLKQSLDDEILNDVRGGSSMVHLHNSPTPITPFI